MKMSKVKYGEQGVGGRWVGATTKYLITNYLMFCTKFYFTYISVTSGISGTQYFINTNKSWPFSGKNVDIALSSQPSQIVCNYPIIGLIYETKM